MIHLLLSIVSSTGIFFIFRTLERYNAPVFPVIVLNYVTAAALGLIATGNIRIRNLDHSPGFYLLAIMIGILFIVMFFVVSRSSRKAGMGITTIASKMSVMFPMLFSIIYDPDDPLTLLKSAGILMTLTGLLMTIYKGKHALRDASSFYLPILLFLGMGLVDSLVKLSQFLYVDNEKLALFTTMLFSISALSGILALAVRPGLAGGFRHRLVIPMGLLLGIVNYGSIFFLVRALNHETSPGELVDSSVVFGINNIGIVCLSVLLGMMVFREKMSRVNFAGMTICMGGTVVLAWSF